MLQIKIGGSSNSATIQTCMLYVVGPQHLASLLQRIRIGNLLKQDRSLQMAHGL
jgi:hypothetical protein